MPNKCSGINGINGTIRIWLGEYLKHRYVVLEHGFLKLSGKVEQGSTGRNAISETMVPGGQ